jgi:hypothetical protein
MVHLKGVLVSALLLMPSVAAASCDQTAIHTTSAQLQDARSDLANLPAPADGRALGKRAATAIAEMKARLAAFSLAYMQCQPVDIDAPGIEADLSRLGWSSNDPARPRLALSFAARALAQGLIGIAARFGAPCGEDTQLMVFDARGGEWREVLRVGGKAQAFSAFDYAIALSEDDGSWMLVEKHLPAACVSPNAAIAYSVLRPTANPLAPRILFTRTESRGGDDTGRLTLSPHYFELRFHSDSMNRHEIVRRYVILGDRVQPAD